MLTELLPAIALTIQPVIEEPTPSLCEANETEVFSGSVQDDFGFDLAVCVLEQGEERPARVTIRWEGEGGGDSVSCLADECEGTVELSRYTRPRVTIMKLAWVKDGTLQGVSQTLDASNDAELARSLMHSWRRLDEPRDPGSNFPILSAHDPLSLLALERYLPLQDWSKALLDTAAGNQGR